MDWQDAAPLPTAHVWRWRLLAALLILANAVGHLAYLSVNCPLDLSPDEAHYWDWSRNLDWSYYSKGPLVAYLIRAGCEIAGPASIALIGNEMLAVRLPAVLCGSLFLVSLYVLTTQVYRREGLAASVVAVALTMPLVTAGSILMTIDSPYTCCWGWALVFGHHAVFHRSTWAWLGAGVAVGLGILAKYTMVLWPASLALFLLASPSHRHLLVRRGFWLMVGVAAFCSVPIVIWNINHDWLSIRHVMELAGASRMGADFQWLGPIRYLGVQFAILLGYWFVAWAIAMFVHRPGREPDPSVRYLWFMSAVVFLVFLAFSFKTGGGEANWPATAYISGLVLSAGWIVRQLQRPSQAYRRVAVGGLATICVLGFALTLGLRYSELLHPALSRCVDGDLRLRRVDPTCRLRGWRTLATEVDRFRDQLHAEGVEPVLAGAGWTLPGEVAFYCRKHPTVHSLGRALGDRHSQYDCWRPNPVSEASHFVGRTFILVGCGADAVSSMFDEVSEAITVTHSVNGESIARWNICIGRGFKGCPQALTARSSRF